MASVLIQLASVLIQFELQEDLREPSQGISSPELPPIPRKNAAAPFSGQRRTPLQTHRSASLSSVSCSLTLDRKRLSFRSSRTAPLNSRLYSWRRRSVRDMGRVSKRQETCSTYSWLHSTQGALTRLALITIGTVALPRHKVLLKVGLLQRQRHRLVRLQSHMFTSGRGV